MLFATWFCLFLLLEGVVVSARLDGFIHLSDLHISVHTRRRQSHLHQLIRKQLPTFNFSTVLITGDIVHAKDKRNRSNQDRAEWEGYQRAVTLDEWSFEASQQTFVDIRGNHDVFDVSSPSHDFFASFASQGESWQQGRVLITPTVSSELCPVYCLIGIDLSPEIGLRSPTNFFGTVKETTIDELERRLIEHMRRWFSADCYPTYLAYGHYPLSLLGEEVSFLERYQLRLRQVLLKYGITTWLCGHLHDAFGNHLHRLHRGEASTLLELETTDWKERRRLRIVTIDDGHLSFMDLEYRRHKTESKNHSLRLAALDNDVRLDGAVVHITYPPSPYYAPLGNSGKAVDLSKTRALVWPMNLTTLESDSTDEHTAPDLESFNVVAGLYCANSQQPLKQIVMHPIDQRFVYEATIEGNWGEICKEREIQIEAAKNGSNLIAYSERRWIESSSKAIEFPHRFLEWLGLAYPWGSIFRELFTTMILVHIVVFILLPKALGSLDQFQKEPRSPNGKLNNCGQSSRSAILLTAIRGLIKANQWSLFFWGQLSYAVYVLLGPWYFARVLHDRPLGVLFVYTIYVSATEGKLNTIRSPELPFRACFYYTFAIFPTYIWLAWTICRHESTANENHGLPRGVMWWIYIITGLIPLAEVLITVRAMWMFYGVLSVLLSPVLIGWIVLTTLTFNAARRITPKCQKEKI